MSAADRWESAEGQPEPRPLSALTRPELCARIHVLRAVLDLLVDQMQADGGESFACRGRVKIELLALEHALFMRDRDAERGEPMPLPVALAQVSVSAARMELPKPEAKGWGQMFKRFGEVVSEGRLS